MRQTTRANCSYHKRGLHNTPSRKARSRGVGCQTVSPHQAKSVSFSLAGDAAVAGANRIAMRNRRYLHELKHVTANLMCRGARVPRTSDMSATNESGGQAFLSARIGVVESRADRNVHTPAFRFVSTLSTLAEDVEPSKTSQTTTRDFAVDHSPNPNH